MKCKWTKISEASQFFDIIVQKPILDNRPQLPSSDMPDRLCKLSSFSHWSLTSSLPSPPPISIFVKVDRMPDRNSLGEHGSDQLYFSSVNRKSKIRTVMLERWPFSWPFLFLHAEKKGSFSYLDLSPLSNRKQKTRLFSCAFPLFVHCTKRRSMRPPLTGDGSIPKITVLGPSYRGMFHNLQVLSGISLKHNCSSA